MKASPTTDERRPLLQLNSAADGDEPKKHYNTVGLSKGAFWALIFASLSAAFLNALDGTIVSSLVSPISSTFEAANLASWLGTSYMMSNCCFTPIYGRLCNILGRQTSMMLALTIFALGTVGCAIAPTMGAMIAARAVAGLGGGGISTVGSTIISDVVPLSMRGIFNGYGNLMFGLGVSAGPALGGLIQDSIGWRWAFWFQLPIMAAVMFCNYRFVRYELALPSPSAARPGSDPRSTPSPEETVRDKVKRIDFLGSFLLAATLALLLIPISLVTDAPDPVLAPKWTDPLILGQLCASGVAFLIFILVEARFAKEPVVPFSLLRRPTALSVAANFFLMSVCILGIMYTAPLYLTVVRQLSASSVGQHLAIIAPCTITSAFLTGFYVRKFGTYKHLAIAGQATSTLGIYLLSTWRQDSAASVFWWQYPIILFGVGNSSTSVMVGMIADVGREHVAIITALAYFARTTGQVFGVAFSGAILQSLLANQLPKRITGPNKQAVIDLIRRSSAAVRTLPAEQKQAAIEVYDWSITWIFTGFFWLSALGTLVLFGMRNLNVNDELVKQQRMASEPETQDEESRS